MATVELRQGNFGITVKSGIVLVGYHKPVGCRSGACPITANPYISMLYGAVMGFLAGGGMGK
jgi:hypothetical protein